MTSLQEAVAQIRAHVPAHTPVAVVAFCNVTDDDPAEMTFHARIGDILDAGRIEEYGKTLDGVTQAAIRRAPEWQNHRSRDEAELRRLAKRLGYDFPPGGE